MPNFLIIDGSTTTIATAAASLPSNNIVVVGITRTYGTVEV